VLRRRPVVQLLSASLLVLLLGTAADATWMRIETDKFVVYGDGSEETLRAFAGRLSTFDAVLRKFHPTTQTRTPATKVQVYVVSDSELRRIHPDAAFTTAGFYAANTEGVFAVALERNGLGGDDVLFHEYAHHFMRENFPAAHPAWFEEGWAEYFATTEIDGDKVRVGNFNPARVEAQRLGTQVSIDELLTANVAELGPHKSAVFYQRAWLLMHYMRSDPRRAEQLDEAIRAIAKGAEPVQAFEKATGKTTAELSAELSRYQSLPVLTLKTPAGSTPRMRVTALPASADPLLLDNLRLLLGLAGEDDQAFLEHVRSVAAHHRGDHLAETTRARAEFVLGDVKTGEAIMRRRLEAHPDDVDDLLLASFGQIMAGRRKPAERTERFRAARKHLAKAYARDKTDFRVLFAYAASRSVEPNYPNENDLNALLEARNLAPGVQETAFWAGVALAHKGRRDEAAKMLGPIVNNPHGGTLAERARAILAGQPDPGS